MKREFLQNLKVGEEALPKEVIDAIMAENGRDIEAAKTAAVKPYADYNDIKAENQRLKDRLHLLPLGADRGSPTASRRRQRSSTALQKQNRRKPTPLRDAVFLLWTLPRAKQVSTGHLLAPVCALVPPFRVPRRK